MSIFIRGAFVQEQTNKNTPKTVLFDSDKIIYRLKLCLNINFTVRGLFVLTIQLPGARVWLVMLYLGNVRSHCIKC